MTKVEVEIDANGQVKVHVVGVAGPSCMKLTDALERELGNVTGVVKTAEYYKTPTTTPTQQKRLVTQ
jgi:uridine kinase